MIMPTNENKCEFCGMITHTNKHHIIPRAVGGKETIPTCEVCESYIHRTWSHRELRDTYNNVEVILADEGFKRFLKWRKKQSATTLFKSQPNKYRDKNPYH